MNQPKGAIEDEYLVIPTKTALPKRCVKTNAEISDNEYRSWDLPYFPSLLAKYMMISPFFLIAMPFATRSRCKFKAGLSSDLRKRFQRRKYALYFSMFLALASVPVAAIARSEFWMILAIGLTPTYLWVAFVMLILFTSPLKVARKNDQLYWIKGCSPEFLASLKAVAKDG